MLPLSDGSTDIICLSRLGTNHRSRPLIPSTACVRACVAQVGHAFAAEGLPELGVGDGWEVCESSQASSGRWQLDDAVTFCPLCANDFGIMLRRHHCRTCGACALYAHRLTVAACAPATQQLIPTTKLTNGLRLSVSATTCVTGGVFCDDCTALTKQSNRESRMCKGCRAASFVN